MVTVLFSHALSPSEEPSEHVDVASATSSGFAACPGRGAAPRSRHRGPSLAVGAAPQPALKSLELPALVLLPLGLLLLFTQLCPTLQLHGL